jgi:hypothetical protein
MLKTILFASLAVAFAFAAYPSPSSAQTNCTQLGNRIICPGPNGSVTNCLLTGNRIICN